MDTEELQEDSPRHAWHAVSSFGRKPVFRKGTDLIRAAIEYFDWAENNPMRLPGSGTKSKAMMRHRLKTVMGLCTFLAVSRRTFSGWLSGEQGPEMQAAAEWIDDILKQNALELAAADFVNSGLVSRLLSVNESIEITTRRIETGDGTEEAGTSAAELEAELEKIVTDVTGRPFRIQRGEGPEHNNAAEGTHDS